jgi:hypothetical protein
MSNNPELSFWRQTLLPSLSLFASAGTLLCCALPALLVTLGMGAALAGFVGAFPWVTAISAYKAYVFIIAGGLLSLATFLQWRARHAPCPADKDKARVCKMLRKVSWGILAFSIIIYVIGLFFAFIAVHIFF